MLIDHAVHICMIHVASTGICDPPVSHVPLWHLNFSNLAK